MIFHNSTDVDDFLANYRSLVEWVHFSRGLIAIVAIMANLLVIGLFWRASRRRPSDVCTRINYAVINLLIANILSSIMLCVYSFLKRFANGSLSNTRPCLTLSWLAVFASFEPLLATGLVSFARLIKFTGNDRMDKLFNTGRLVWVRIGIVVLHVIAASLIITEETEDAQCNYHVMLDNSSRYLVYSLFVSAVLVSLGITGIVSKIKLRRAILRQIHAAAENAPKLDTNTISSTVASGDFLSKLDNNNVVEVASDQPKPHVPATLLEKPKLLLIALTVVFLFLAPKIASFANSRPFWVISTLCPVSMAFVLPVAFLWTTKDYREELARLVMRKQAVETKT